MLFLSSSTTLFVLLAICVIAIVISHEEYMLVSCRSPDQSATLAEYWHHTGVGAYPTLSVLTEEGV
jgi:hypothetical protein